MIISKLDRPYSPEDNSANLLESKDCRVYSSWSRGDRQWSDFYLGSAASEATGTIRISSCVKCNVAVR